MIDVRTLTDGGQRSEDVARMLSAFIGDARRTLDLALYDLCLRGGAAAILADAFARARAAGVRTRVVYNDMSGDVRPIQRDAAPAEIDGDGPPRIPVPPPSACEPGLLAAAGADIRAIPGFPDLMHHKYVIRDGTAVWTGSVNWRDDAWSREENVIAVVSSAAVAARYERDFAQLWDTRDVARSGAVDPDPLAVGGARVRVWFTPGHGRGLAHRIANAFGDARRRIRVGSPIVTSGPILGTLAEVAQDGRVDLSGALDATQVREVMGQWARQHRDWKRHLVMGLVARAPFSGKPSTPWRPDSVHDFMHAKVSVADDTVFLGSYNLSHAGEQNAENVLEIEDAALADRLAAFVDAIRARYPRLVL